MFSSTTHMAQEPALIWNYCLLAFCSTRKNLNLPFKLHTMQDSCKSRSRAPAVVNAADWASQTAQLRKLRQSEFGHKVQDSFWRATFIKWFQAHSHAKKNVIYYWCTGEYTFKASSKNTTRLQSFILQRLLFILKGVHNRHIWHNRTHLSISPKSEHTQMQSWVEHQGFTLKYVLLSAERAYMSFAVRISGTGFTSGLREQNENCSLHLTVIVTFSLSWSIHWSVIAVNLLEIHWEGYTNKLKARLMTRENKLSLNLTQIKPTGS